jgi:hypothetical protein
MVGHGELAGEGKEAEGEGGEGTRLECSWRARPAAPLPVESSRVLFDRCCSLAGREKITWGRKEREEREKEKRKEKKKKNAKLRNFRGEK